MNRILRIGLPLVLLAMAFAACGGRAQHRGPVSPEARRYIDTALVVVRTHALDADTVNWDSLRLQTLRRAAGAQTSADTHEALQWLVTRVNRHSRLLLPELWAEVERNIHENPPEPSGAPLLGGVGYLSLPAFASSDLDLELAYSRRAHQLIRALAPVARCGWILDLRGNTGGEFYPMLLAVGPLLGDGPAGFMRGGVSLINVWGYRNGRVWLDYDTMFALTRRDTVAPPQSGRVAVLVGSRTASAAEAVAISFAGLPRSASFGSATAGLTTGNRGYRLDDGAYMLVTETVLGDRLAREYGGKMLPDYRTGTAWLNVISNQTDLTVRAALDWLGRQPGCNIIREVQPGF